MTYKNKINALIYMAILLFGCCTSNSQPINDEGILSTSYDEAVVPIIRVVSNPNAFNGKNVTLTGYYLEETHINALFVDKESCASYSTENSILVGDLDVDIDNIQQKACSRLTMSGVLKYTREYYGSRYKSDMYIESAVIVK